MKKPKVRNYKKIEAWLLASDLAVAIYASTGKFPSEEKYGLVSQIRRASISVLSCIAEGAGRQHKKEYLQFLYIARGSLTETESLLEISVRLSFLKYPHFQDLISLCKKTARCLFGLIQAVGAEVHCPLSRPPQEGVVHCPTNKEANYV